MEFNSNRKAALAVTAGLVGALTLGGAAVAVAPAYADDAALQSVKPELANSAVTAENGLGEDVTVKDNQVAELAAESGAWLKVTEVDGVALADSGYAVSYRYDNNGEPGTQIYTLSNVPVTDANANAYFNSSSYKASRTKAGKTYWAVLTKGSKTIEIPFTYTDGKAVTYTAVDKDGGTEFTFNGAAVDLWVKRSDSSKLVQMKAPSVTDVKYYTADGNETYPDDASKKGTAPVDAGTYTAKWNGDTQSVTFTISPLDLSKVNGASAGVVKLNDTDGIMNENDLLAKLGLNAGVKVSKVGSASNPSAYNGKSGTYTAELAPAKADDGNVVNAATVTYDVVDRLDVGKAQYGVSAPAGGVYTIDQSQGQAFDASKVKYVLNGKTYSGDQIVVSYKKDTDGDGSFDKAVSAADLNQPGDYELTVYVKPFKDYSKLVSSTNTLKVTVAAASIIADEGVTFRFGGEVVADDSGEYGVSNYYDGSDLLKSIATEVKDSDGKVYEAGKDYKVVVKDAATDEEVDKIVDAGKYTVTVVPVTFEKGDTAADAADWTLTVEVKRVPVEDDTYTYTDDKGVEHAGNTATGLADATVVYSGSDKDVPAARFLVHNADGSVKLDESNQPVYADLASDLYTVTSVRLSGKKVDKLNAAGVYTVRIAATEKGAKNFDLKDKEFKVTVRKATSFADVDPTAWYAKGVETAYNNYYVNGIAGTDLFAPMADITRADAVCVLFNMAGGSKSFADDEFSYNDFFGYETGFSDVNGKAYYAKAIAWAKAAGVANGYGDGTFKPAVKISREEFASFLMKYAKSKGAYTAPEGDALAGMSDASTVSAWAKGAVNWAVSNKVMGNGGFVAGQSRITRAEVAVMGANYQPKTLDGYTRLNPRPADKPGTEID